MLCDLKRQDRGFGARWAAAAREKIDGFIGPKRTWTKVLGLVFAIVIACLILVKATYRVEAEFILRSDEVSF